MPHPSPVPAVMGLGWDRGWQGSHRKGLKLGSGKKGGMVSVGAYWIISNLLAALLLFFLPGLMTVFGIHQS